MKKYEVVNIHQQGASKEATASQHIAEAGCIAILKKNCLQYLVPQI